MPDVFDYERDDAICPSCNYGRIRVTRQPYVRVFRAHLFTIPDALCFTCDVCEYCEFEETSVDLMIEMISISQVTEGDTSQEPKSSTSPVSPLLPEDGDSQGSTSHVNP